MPPKIPDSRAEEGVAFMKAILPVAIGAVALGTDFSCSWKPKITCTFRDMVPGRIVLASTRR